MSHARCRPLRRTAVGLVAAVAVGVVSSAVVAGGSALAAASGSLAETIVVASPPVYAVTVSPASVAICPNGAAVGFPNGTCYSTAITVTNGPVPAKIYVSGADAIPTDGGTRWTLCGGTGGSACTIANDGFFSVPGQDQYLEATYTAASSGPLLTGTAQCDTAFSANHTCAAAANQSSPPGPSGVGYSILFEGPSASSDPSSTFTSTVTWTAAP